MTEFKVGDRVKPNLNSVFWGPVIQADSMLGVVIEGRGGGFAARVEWRHDGTSSPHYDSELLLAENGLETMLKVSFGE